MSNAPSARQAGDDYQAYRFWMSAADMLRPTSRIGAVGYETGAYRAFDDTVVKYTQPRIHAHGIHVEADYLQIKHSVNYGKAITAEALIDPAFSGAEAVSFLERLRDAVGAMPAGMSHRFVLLTPRPLDPNDVLARLVSSSDGSINCDALFGGKTRNSLTGAVRARWASKLGLGAEKDLVPILQRLMIDVLPQNIQRVIEDLNARLEAAGLQSWPEAHRANPYPQLIRRLRAEGKQWFTGACIKAAANQDGLLLPEKPSATFGKRLGIRTFARWAENMEDKADAFLCLCEHYVDRQIRSPELWDSAITPLLIEFLKKHVAPGTCCLLDLQALSSVAFLAGYLLEPKLNVNISIVQDRGCTPWQLDLSRLNSVPDEWDQRVTCETDGGHLVVGIGLTRPVADDVVAYARTKFSAGVRMVHLSPQCGCGQKVILNATHAYGLAQHAIDRVAALRKQHDVRGPTHFFVSAPNIFTFFLGQLARPLGQIRLYEYAFGSGRTGAYLLSFHVHDGLRL